MSFINLRQLIYHPGYLSSWDPGYEEEIHPAQDGSSFSRMHLMSCFLGGLWKPENIEEAYTDPGRTSETLHTNLSSGTNQGPLNAIC